MLQTKQDWEKRRPRLASLTNTAAPVTRLFASNLQGLKKGLPKRLPKRIGKSVGNAFAMGARSLGNLNTRFWSLLDGDGHGGDSDSDDVDESAAHAYPGFVILKVEEQIDKFIGVILMNSVKHPFFIPFEFDFKSAQMMFKSPFESSTSKCSVVDKRVWPWTEGMIKNCAEAATENKSDAYVPLQIHPQKEAILEMLVGGDDERTDDPSNRLFEVEETLGSKNNLKPDIMVFLDGQNGDGDESGGSSDDEDGGGGGRAAPGVGSHRDPKGRDGSFSDDPTTRGDGVKRGRILFNPRDAATSRRTRKTNTVYFVQKENESVVRYFRDKQSKEVLLPQQLQELFIAIDRGRLRSEEDDDGDDDDEDDGKKTDYTIKLTESFLNTQTDFKNSYDGDPPYSVRPGPAPSVMFYPIMLLMMMYERTHEREAMTKTPAAKMKSANYDKYLSKILLGSLARKKATASPPPTNDTATNKVLDYILGNYVFIQEHVGGVDEPARIQPRFFFAERKVVEEVKG